MRPVEHYSHHFYQTSNTTMHRLLTYIKNTSRCFLSLPLSSLHSPVQHIIHKISVTVISQMEPCTIFQSKIQMSQLIMYAYSCMWLLNWNLSISHLITFARQKCVSINVFFVSAGTFGITKLYSHIDLNTYASSSFNIVEFWPLNSWRQGQMVNACHEWGTATEYNMCNCVPSLVLIAQGVFLLNRGHTDTQSNRRHWWP